jgi:hypothetical protein
MKQLIDRIDPDDLLLRMPSTVRTSLEALERAGADWNTVGNLLAAAPTGGVALAGTGQWTSDLWQAVKWEFRSFLCTDSEPYAKLRADWNDVTRQSSAAAVSSLAAVIGHKLGVASGVLVPMVTWLFLVARRMGREALCLTLSHGAAPSAN